MLLNSKRQVVIIKNNSDFSKPDILRALAEDAITHTYECFGRVFTDDVANEERASDACLEIGIITQGVGVHSINGNTVPCKSGDIYIVPPGVAHAYFSAAEGERLIVRKLLFRVQDWFHGEAALWGSKRYCYGAFRDGGEVAYAMLNARMNEKINGIMDDVESELYDKEEGWKNVVFTYLVQIFSFLGRYINRSLKNAFKKTKDWETASLAMKIIEDEFSNHELSLEAIASRVYVSPSKLSRVFKQEIGQLFSEYLRDVRLNYAAKLLKETDLSAEKIIFECGFYGASSFYRNFREAFGMTPQIYKQIEESKEETKKINYNEKKDLKMEILKEISLNVQNGKAKAVKELVQRAIDEGAVIEEILNEGLISGMNIIGEKFKNNEVFVPEVLISARAMNMGAQLLKPLLVANGVAAKGKVCIGTVQGDLHDIGKNLVKMMMEGKGLEVVDLGTDVAPEAFVNAVINEGCQIICCSALLTTTMPVMAEVVKAAETAGVREKIKIMIGGAPINDEFCKKIGADVYTPDAASAADAAVRLCQAL